MISRHFPVSPLAMAEEEMLEEEVHPISAAEMEGEDVGGAELDEKWASLIDYIKAQNPILGSLLRYGRLLHLDEEKIEIGFEKSSFYLEKMSEEKNRRECEGVCRDFLKKDLRLVFRDFTGEKRSDGAEGVRIKAPTDRDRHLKKEAMENPVIKETVEIFDGTIEEIKTGVRSKP